MWSNCNCCCGYGEAVSFFQQACFSIMGALPSYHIFFPPHESLNSPIVTWNGTLKSKNVIKIWTTKWVNFQGNLKIFSVCGAFMTTKAHCRQKTFSPPFNRIFRGMSSLYRPNPNGNPWWVPFMTNKACCKQKTFSPPFTRIFREMCPPLQTKP